jgi:protocatechuate 3,4-dioxygenase beta subunit
LTASNIEGPFYKPGAPERSKLPVPFRGGISLVGPPIPTLVVEGRVVDDRCRPVPGARLDVWQADHTGAYDNDGFGMRGQLRTDADGRYRFETLRPGHYLNGDRYRPAHIHVKVGATGHRRLTTQLYFPNDPYNAGDPFILPSLVMTLRDEGGAGDHARFDFVLART